MISKHCSTVQRLFFICIFKSIILYIAIDPYFEMQEEERKENFGYETCKFYRPVSLKRIRCNERIGCNENWTL